MATIANRWVTAVSGPEFLWGGDPAGTKYTASK